MPAGSPPPSASRRPPSDPLLPDRRRRHRVVHQADHLARPERRMPPLSLERISAAQADRALRVRNGTCRSLYLAGRVRGQYRRSRGRTGRTLLLSVADLEACSSTNSTENHMQIPASTLNGRAEHARRATADTVRMPAQDRRRQWAALHPDRMRAAARRWWRASGRVWRAARRTVAL